MTGSTRLALALVPLAIYFFLLASWQSSRKPRVVPGPMDFGLLSFGLGNLLAFGPVGQVVVNAVFPSPSVWAWLTVAALIALFALIYAPQTARRLIVYRVSDEELKRAVFEALSRIDGRFDPTVSGFEDRKAGCGVTIESGSKLQFGVVESYGNECEVLTAKLAPELRKRLREISSPPSRLGALWAAFGSIALIMPLSSFLLSRTAVRAAIQALLQRLHGG